MLRIITYILLGILIAQSCALLKGPNKPLEEASTRIEFPEVHSRKINQCSDDGIFASQCLYKVSVISDKPL